MSERRNDRTDERAQEQSDTHEGGYEGAAPEYGRGYGRDFGGGGLNQGFDGSHGEGYGGSAAPGDYREDFGGEAYASGMAAGDYDRSHGARGAEFRADDRTWMDRCADDECQGRSHHRGRGPKDWSRDDRRLYEEICERLLSDRLIDAREIVVEVEGGVVTLRGQARAPADPLLAEELVRRTPGVKGLEIDLRVGPETLAARRALVEGDDDRVDRSSMTSPIIPGRAPPPDPAGAP